MTEHRVSKTLVFFLAIIAFLATLYAANAATPIVNPYITPTTAYFDTPLIGYCNATDTDLDVLNSSWTWYKDGTSNITGTYTEVICKQETPNVTSSCGGLSTGSYTWSATNGWFNPPFWDPELAFDDDYDNGARTAFNSIGTFLINYTVPSNTQSALWEVKDPDFGDELTYNLSINSTCLNLNPLQLRVIVANGAGEDYVLWQCYNDSAWLYLRGDENEDIDGDGGSSAAVFYEETIYWNISSNTTPVSDLVNPEVWTLECTADDGGVNSTTVNASITISNYAPTIDSIIFTKTDGTTSDYKKHEGLSNISIVVTDSDNATLSRANVSFQDPFNTFILEDEELIRINATLYLVNNSQNLSIDGAWDATVCADDGVNTVVCNTTTITVVDTTSSPAPPAGGGGGGVDLSKRTCAISLTPEKILVTNINKIAEVTLINNDDITYTPDAIFQTVSGDDITGRLELASIIGTVRPGETQSFGIGYVQPVIGDIPTEGVARFILQHGVCEDIYIEVELRVNETNTITEFVSGDEPLLERSKEFLQSSITSKAESVKVWWLLVFFAFVVGIVVLLANFQGGDVGVFFAKSAAWVFITPLVTVIFVVLIRAIFGV